MNIPACDPTKVAVEVQTLMTCLMFMSSVYNVTVTTLLSSYFKYQHIPPARERAADARRPSGGNRQSHPVVGGKALTPRYSPPPRLDKIRPAAAPPEEPPELSPSVDIPYPHVDTQSMSTGEAHTQVNQATTSPA
ncbi:unnamed protein product, partial [Brenthis ino]